MKETPVVLKLEIGREGGAGEPGTCLLCPNRRQLKEVEGFLRRRHGKLESGNQLQRCSHLKIKQPIDGICPGDLSLVLVSLAQLILNPDTRTTHGLEALIEREWIQG